MNINEFDSRVKPCLRRVRSAKSQKRKTAFPSKILPCAVLPCKKTLTFGLTTTTAASSATAASS